jgi:thymidine kinase
MNLSFIPSIDIIIGPVQCGKTSEIIRRLVIYHDMDMKVLYINSVLDTRSDSVFSTHNITIGKIPFDGVKLKELKGYDVGEYDVIAVDEAQFFDDLRDVVLGWVEGMKKIVIVGGLNGDFRRDRFGRINELISYCDSITKLNPFCVLCRRRGEMRAGIFSKRVNVVDECTVLIGGKDVYLPSCRECFNDNNLRA